jgi:sugar (pentulose or hexulose) kinase
MDTTSAERIRNTLTLPNKYQRRLYLANEAKAIGFGGISQVSRVSGVSRMTIMHGLKEIDAEGYQATEAKRWHTHVDAALCNWLETHYPAQAVLVFPP